MANTGPDCMSLATLTEVVVSIVPLQVKKTTIVNVLKNGCVSLQSSKVHAWQLHAGRERLAWSCLRLGTL